MNKAFYALGRLKKGRMNNTEFNYSKRLDVMKQSGEILWYSFEALKFRLADNTSYTPDFVVMRYDGLIELHETKGFWTDDARVKIKVAAEMYPFRFKAIKWEKKQWVEEVFE